MRTFALAALLLLAPGCVGLPPCNGELVTPGGCPSGCASAVNVNGVGMPACLKPVEQLCSPAPINNPSMGCLVRRSTNEVFVTASSLVQSGRLLDSWRACTAAETALAFDARDACR